MAVSVAAFLLIGVVIAAISMVRLDGKYGPIRNGSFGGIYSARQLVTNPDGTPSWLGGGPGATTQLLASLTNAGSHSVKVTAIDTDDVVADVRWSVLSAVPGGVVSGLDTSWRMFPADLPAHTTIRLLITIHRPASCRTALPTAQRDEFYSGLHQVHWKSLLRSHVTVVDDQIGQIRLC